MPTPIEPEVLPRTNNIPNQGVHVNYPVALNWQTTLQSPFFWIMAGMAIGVYLCRTNKI